MSDSNTGIVLWKIFVPVLTIVTLLLLDFHGGNFTANGGFARSVSTASAPPAPPAWSSPCRASSRTPRWPASR